MNLSKYKTILGTVEHKKNIKKSIFIATIKHVKNTNEARDFIKEISKKYNDATHNCPAYRVIENDQIIEFSSDNGEPSGTAGKPILGVLKRHDLLNICVVVTRYFGGIKLGVRGLIDAYSGVVEELLENIPSTIMILKTIYTIKVKYENYGKAMQDLHYKGFEIINTEFFENFAYIEISGKNNPTEYEIINKKTIFVKEED